MNIRDIDKKEIEYFLKQNNISYTHNPYLIFWNFLIQNKDVLVNESIADWVLAYNISNQNIDTYNPIDILSQKDENLLSLSQRLGLTSIDKTRILRILRYVNKLITLDQLPNDVINKILLSLSDEDIPKLCQISNKINTICNNDFIPYLKEKLINDTGLDVSNYTNKQLFYLSQQSKYRYHNKIATNSEYTLVIINGKVYSFGTSTEGGLGLGSTEETNIPEEIEGLNDIIEVAVGWSYSVALSKSGKVYLFGKNDDSQLGNYGGDTIDTPVEILEINNAISITADENTLAVLTKDGKVHMYGYIYEYKKLHYKDLANIVQISMGDGNLLSLDNNGNVFIYRYAYRDGGISKSLKTKDIYYATFGSDGGFYFIDKNGQLLSSKGKLDSIDIGIQPSPNIKVKRIYTESSYDILVLGSDDNVYNVTKRGYFTKIEGLSNITDISGFTGFPESSSYTLFLDKNNKLYVIGSNNYGQLGLGDSDRRDIITLNDNL